MQLMRTFYILGRNENEQKLLKDFQRVSLEPVDMQTFLICPFEKITLNNPNKAKREIERMEYEVYIGSSDEKDLVKKIIVFNNQKY